MKGRSNNRASRGPESGSVAVEFAILGPIFLVLFIGIMVWGQYFWISHAVQQLANDSARAALAGLDATERESLARDTLATEVGDYASLKASATTMVVEDRSERMVVSIRYDTSDAGYQVLAGLVPSPPKTLVRQATVRLGGY